jgi:predicted aspartyl protease
VLRRLGARRTGRSAAVVTASGVITAPVFVVDEVVVGDRTFPDHPVLGLDLEDAGVAGLLGMDVLGTTGLPRL